jgi:hypothetical protein
MTPSAFRCVGSRRFGAIVVSLALIASLFLPTAALASGPYVILGLAPGQQSPTNVSPINLTVTFQDPVEGFTGSDLQLWGSAGGTWIATVTGGPKVFNVAITGMTTIGVIYGRVPAGVAHNPADEPNLESNVLGGAYWTPGPYVYVERAAGQGTPTGTSPINWKVTFQDPVEGFTGSDVVVDGTAGGSKTAIVTGGPKAYNVAVTGMTTGGTMNITVPDGVAFNPAGEGNAPGYGYIGSDVVWAPGGPSVTVDQAPGQPDPANTSPIRFQVAFSSDIDVRLVDLSKVIVSGTAGGVKVLALSQLFSGDFKHWILAVSGMSTGGTVIVTMPEGVLVTIDGRPNHASTSTDNTVTWSPPPTVSINQAAGQADPTGASPINFAVVFSAPVTGFSSGDVIIGGTAGGTKTATVSGAGTTYNVAVGGMTTNGSVVATVPAGVAVAAGMQGNAASTSTDNTVTWAPTVAGPLILTTSAPIPRGAKDPVIRWGQGFELGVQFATNGANRSLELQGSRDGSTWSKISILTTDASGRAALLYRPVTNLFYRAVYAGAPDHPAATSNQVRTVVRQLAVMRPTNRGSTKVINRSTTITFTTTVRPARPELAPPSVTFSFYRRVSGSWQRIIVRAVPVDSSGKAVTTFQFGEAGQWYVRSQAGPTPYNANSDPTPIERYSVR